VEFEQFYLESLGHASYLVGATGGGDALVLDPRRDVEVYLQAATASGLRIRYILDTHQHNDYLSGSRELAERTGATVLAGDQAQVAYDHRAVRDGEQLDLGDLGIQMMHTPGHTPEHLSLLLYDGEVSRDEPAVLLSGGALLVGDVARPDLFGDEEQTRQAASTMCTTLQTTLLELPDHTIVYPTHVSGSLCGGSIASRLSTTIGYEKRTNPMLARVAASNDFVDQCLNLDNLPAVPPYWARMRTENQRGPGLLGAVPPPPALQPADFADAAADPDLIVLDARPAEAFAGGHIPGAVNVGLSTSFATWAGTVLPAGARVLLVVSDPAEVMEATWQLLRIGYPTPAGWLAGGMFAYRTTGRPLAQLDTLTVHDIRHRGDGLHLLDVRQPGEWAAYHAPDAQFITGAEICDRLVEIPRDRDVLVACGSGYRSSVVASLLQRNGHDRVHNLLGGMTAWKNADLPTT
jgi:hydroxyacylglutathione hydrolase